MDSQRSPLAHCLDCERDTEHMVVTQDTLVILGSGYTGRSVMALASRRYRRVVATSRDPGEHLREVPAGQRIEFDLARPDTWKHIPETADLLWCFPAAPVEQVQKLAAEMQVNVRRVVVLGSTSAYDLAERHNAPPPWIDETAHIDVSKPRVKGEEFLRAECRAIVLRLAGIYGPGRNPIDWIKSGRVGPWAKYVNLIHVEDVAAICLAALEQGIPGDAYNVSDGTPRTWKDICDMARERWGITCPPAANVDDSGKRISNAKLTRQLGYAIQHPDLFHELHQLPH